MFHLLQYFTTVVGKENVICRLCHNEMIFILPPTSTLLRNLLDFGLVFDALLMLPGWNER